MGHTHWMRLVAAYVGSRRCLQFKAHTSMVACWGGDVWLDSFLGQEVLPVLPQTSAILNFGLSEYPTATLRLQACEARWP